VTAEKVMQWGLTEPRRGVHDVLDNMRRFERLGLDAAFTEVDALRHGDGRDLRP
jgi:hypothetical protein